MNPIRALWRKVTGRLSRGEGFFPAELAVARSANGTVVISFDLGEHTAAVVLPRGEAVRLADILIDGLLEKEV